MVTPVNFGSNPVTNLPPGTVDNQTFDVLSAQMSQDGTQILDDDGEWVDLAFMEQMAHEKQSPNAALALVLADLRQQGVIGIDTEFTPDEMKAIVAALSDFAVGIGIADDKDGVHSQKATNWITALVQALGAAANKLSDEIAVKSLAIIDTPGGTSAGPGTSGQPKDLFELDGLAGTFEMFMSAAAKIIDSAVEGTSTPVKR